MFSYVFDQIPLPERNEGHSKIFVAHSYRDKMRADLRAAVRHAFEPELTPYYADEELGTHHLLIKLARRIFVSRIVLIDLSYGNENVVLELGLALGLNKPIILCCHQSATVPDFVQGLNIIRYRDYHQLTGILESQKYQASEIAIGTPRTGWCQLCQQVCSGRVVGRYNEHGLIVDDALATAGYQKDFEFALREAVKPLQLKLTTLDSVHQMDTMRLLCSYLYIVGTSQFTIFRFVEGMSLLVPFLFGLSFGLRIQPILLVQKTFSNKIPSDLAGYPFFEFNNFGEIRTQFTPQLSKLKQKTIPSVLADEWRSKFGEKAKEALVNIQAIISQEELEWKEKLEAALILALYAIRLWAGSLMALTEDEKLQIVAMVAPEIKTDVVVEWREFDISDGICGWVAREQRPYHSENVWIDKLYEKRTFDNKLMSLACVPIIRNGRTLGVINADSRDPDYFHETDIQILEIVAQMLSEIWVEPFEANNKRKIGETKRDVQDLLREPMCLKCGEASILLRFQRKHDEKGLRYMMMSKCLYCEAEEGIRTYQLQFA